MKQNIKSLKKHSQQNTHFQIKQNQKQRKTNKAAERRVQERAHPQLLRPQVVSDKGFRDNGQFKIKT